MKILITGGTGLLGTRFREDALESPEHEIIILTRSSRASDHPRVRFVQWDGASIPDDVGAVDVVMNLAGKNIGEHGWSDKNKEEFLTSRVQATAACVDFIKRASDKPDVFLSGSAVGYYGADNRDIVEEGSPPGDDFLGQLCVQWEAAAQGAGVRTVLLRTGVVLDSESGVLPQMALPFKFGVGGVIGDGEQGFPWIHVADWVSAAWHLIFNDDIEGPVNLVSSQIIDNKGATAALKKVLKRPAFFKVPGFVLKLGLGERSVLLLGGQKVLPQALLQHGFAARFSTLEAALRDLL